jgi:hypothetical protein
MLNVVAPKQDWFTTSAPVFSRGKTDGMVTKGEGLSKEGLPQEVVVTNFVPTFADLKQGILKGEVSLYH